MSQQSFLAMKAIAERISSELGQVVVGYSDRGVHIDPAMAVVALLDRMDAQEARHDRRVTELLDANNRLLERARTAEGRLSDANDTLAESAEVFREIF